MEPITEEFTLTLKYQVSVNTETGEAITKCISREVDKPKSSGSKKSTSKIPTGEGPKLILGDNKYQLTKEAADLLEVSPDDKIDIKYEKQGKNIIPVIASDDIFGTHGGNRLTKSLTVACRGSKNSELAKFGNEFTLVAHPNKNGIFILTNNQSKIELTEELGEDEKIDFPDIDLQDLIDDKDAEITEVSASMFKL